MPLGTVENIVELVGRTPLLHLRRFAPPPLADIYAKLEYMNPGGSVLGGGSAGTVAAAARRVAERLGAGRRIVTLFPDGAERYISQGIFD